MDETIFLELNTEIYRCETGSKYYIALALDQGYESEHSTVLKNDKKVVQIISM